MKNFLRLQGLLLILLCLPAAAWSQTSRDSALAFLYRYMPLPDSIDHPRSWWEQQVDMALRARNEMGWQVPDREWRHFVLPPRVNNESLDDFRSQCYDDLRNRVRGLSMADAILEVNHWCHERVTYQPSDARTRGPLSTIQAGVGRCGEESTLLVSALRMVGIPARQVYTPRWAHTDDNHAWVEAWADGEWYFLGACEPEPVLNLGWFNSSAARGMLMTTHVFGHYDGPEQVIDQNPCLTEINVTRNYAPTAKIRVRTVDEAGNPNPAKVDFKVYNYAEFYTVASLFSPGEVSFEAGLGDLIVWAHTTGGAFDFRKVSVGQDSLVTLVLSEEKDEALSQRWNRPVWEEDIVPPSGKDVVVPTPTDQQLTENKARLQREDSIRQHSTHGNPMMGAFHTGAINPQRAAQVLDVLNEKDKGDTSLDVLTDMLNYSTGTEPHLLGQRILWEQLTPYKSYLQSVLPPMSLEQWGQWVMDSIRIENRNPRGLYASPEATYRARRADVRNSRLLYVAGARALGYPAYVDPVTGVEVPAMSSKADETDTIQQFTLRLLPSDDKAGRATYYTHFTISQNALGATRLMEFPEGMSGEDFSKGVRLPRGQYVLTTGTRLADGTALTRSSFFTLQGDTVVDLQLRTAEEKLQVIGALDAETLVALPDGSRQSILSLTGRGYYVLVLSRQGHEPSNHVLSDLRLCQSEIDAFGRPLLMLDAEANETLVRQIAQSLCLPTSEVPLVVIADSFGRVVWARQGYTIGIGHQLVKALEQL